MLRLRPYLPLAAFLLAPLLSADEKDKPAGLVVALRGHQEAVYGVAFSPDGKQLLTASGDPSVKVWDIAAGKSIKTFAGPNGHTGIILALALSPDGSQFATAAADNTARLWDFPSGKPLRELALKPGPRAIAASADGSKVAAGAADGTIRLWNGADGKLLRDLTGHAGAVTGLAFSPNGQVLASVGADSTLRFWNVADGKALSSFAAHAGGVTGVAYAPGNNAVYTTGDDGTLRYWAPPAAARAPPAPFKDAIAALAFTPDASHVAVAHGKGVRLVNYATGATTRDLGPVVVTVTCAATSATLVAAGAGGKLHLWQAKDGKLVGEAAAHDTVTGVALNGDRAATVGKDGVLRLWALPPAQTRRLDQAARSAIVTADGKRLAVGGDKVMRLYKLDNLKAAEKQFSGHSGPVTALAVSSDVKTVASAGDDGVIRFWSHAKGEQVAAVGAHAGAIVSLELAGGGVQVVSAGDGTVKLWSVPSAGPTSYSHADAVTAAALSPDGTKLLTGCADKQVRLWDLTKGQISRTWTGPTLGVTCVAFSAKGDRVAAGAADRSLWVWEAGGKQVQKLADLPAVVQAVALTADGGQAVAALADGTARVYGLKDGKEAKVFTGHKGALNALGLGAKGDQIYYAGAAGVIHGRGLDKENDSSINHGAMVTALAISRDGALLAAGSDKQVKLYKLPAGKLEATLAVAGAVRGLAFSPDGKRLAVAGGDGRGRVLTLAGQLEGLVVHDGTVNAAFFSTDGKRLLTASADKSARTTALSLMWMADHGVAVRQAAVSPRGDRVLSAGADGTLKIWNKADGKLVQTLRAHAGAVVGVSLSGDGNRAATAGADKTACVWDLAKLPAKTGGKEVDKPLAAMALPDTPRSVALSPNGARVAVGLSVEKKEQVRVFDAATGREMTSLDELAGALAFQTDNRTLLAAGGAGVRLVDVNVLAAFEAHAGGAAGVAFHSNGAQVLTGGADKAVKLWTAATGKLDRTWKMDGAVSAVAFSRDFTQAAAGAGKTLKVWNVADGKEVASLAMPAAAAALSFSSEKGRLATAGKDGRARVWDVATKQEWQGFPHKGGATAVAFHPFSPALATGGADNAVGLHALTLNRLIVVPSAPVAVAATPFNDRVLVACADGKARSYNTGNGSLDRTLEAGEKALSSIAASRNNQLTAVGGADGKVRLFGSDGKLVARVTAPAAPRALAFSGDSKALVGGDADGGLTAWDVVYQQGQAVPADFGKVMQAFKHAKPVEAVAFPTTGSTFYSAAADSAVKAWKLASEVPTRSFNHPNSVNAIAYDPKGERLATGCSDGRLRIFNVAKGTLERDALAHGKPPMQQSVYAVAFSPDGKQVVTGGADGALKLFDAATGKLARELKAYHEKDFPKGHRDSVLAVAFSPDGKELASGSMDGTIKIWNVADGTVARELAHPKLKPDAKGDPPPSHPGWVYGLRWPEAKLLVSAGKAPRLRGYLATWEPATGKMLTGEELKVGSIFGLAVSGDGKFVALGTGGSLRTGTELNQGVVLKMPAK